MEITGVAIVDSVVDRFLAQPRWYAVAVVSLLPSALVIGVCVCRVACQTMQDPLTEHALLPHELVTDEGLAPGTSPNAATSESASSQGSLPGLAANSRPNAEGL